MKPQTARKELIRNKIIEFVRKEISKNRYPGRVELEREFHIDFRSYFPDTIKEVYKSVGIDYNVIKRRIVRNRARLAMLKISRFKKGEGREVICAYIRKCVGNGKFPTIDDIESKFKTRINTHFKGSIKEAYNEAGIKFPSRPNKSGKEKREKKNDILKFVKSKIRAGLYVKRGEIERQLNVDLRCYFPGGRKKFLN